LALPLLLLQLTSADTLRVHDIPVPPAPASVPSSDRYGPPQLRIPTRQGTALVWLLRSVDTVFVAAAMPDSTRSWADDFVLSIDLHGDGGASPGHDDFQWDFRRVLDSSVVFRGRNGHWESPKGDPDWRLKGERSGGGWEVSSRDGPLGWTLLLRLDPVWFAEAIGSLPRVAFRIFDNDPQGFFAWPTTPGVPQPHAVESFPEKWAPVRPGRRKPL
jgi:hypothetical protein